MSYLTIALAILERQENSHAIPAPSTKVGYERTKETKEPQECMHIPPNHTWLAMAGTRR